MYPMYSAERDIQIPFKILFKYGRSNADIRVKRVDEGITTLWNEFNGRTKIPNEGISFEIDAPAIKFDPAESLEDPVGYDSLPFYRNGIKFNKRRLRYRGGELKYFNWIPGTPFSATYFVVAFFSRAATSRRLLVP